MMTTLQLPRLDGVSTALLHGLCGLERVLSGRPSRPGLRRTRVLSGPLKGRVLSMPAIERPSYAFGTYERHIVAALRIHLRPGAVAYDVGAHIGYLTLVMAHRAGHQGTIFAFEPDPRNRAALETNVADNDLHNVRIVPCAVANVSGSVSFATFDYSTVSHILWRETPADARVLSVPAISLDEFVYRDGNLAPNLVKIDVEGAEDKVFRGAVRTLERARPVVIAEVRGGAVWHDIAALMRSLGYTAHILGSSARRASGLVEIPASGLADVVFTPQGRGQDG